MAQDDGPNGEDSKVCPYCAETIKAAAIVCRYCGRDLVGGTESEPGGLPLASAAAEDMASARLDKEIRRRTADDYRVVWREGHRAQLVKPKQFSLGWALFWLLPAVLLQIFTGIGIILFPIGFVIYLLYYMAKHDEVLYLDGNTLLALDEDRLQAVQPAGAPWGMILLMAASLILIGIGLSENQWVIALVGSFLAVIFLIIWLYRPE